MHLLLTLVLSALGALSTPVHKAQSPFGTLPPLSEDDHRDEAMEALLGKYAPVVKLSGIEAFFPSSIEYMLPHYTFTETPDGSILPINSTLLTPSLLDALPDEGQNQFMSIPEDHNPQPFILDDKSNYLFGPAGQQGGMSRGKDGRGIVEEDVYGFWVDRGKDVVDLWYWTFYPFNFGKAVGPFGVLGNHVGDWEYLRLRTINGSAVSVDYHSHNGGAFSSGTTRWSDTPKIDGRPVAFCAAGSHGLWPTPGDHVFANVLDVFRLVDVTDDDGAIWDTKGHVVASQFWESPRIRRKIRHHGERSWLNFRGMWGNRGTDNCWWYKLVGNCQLVDAPPGPNRWFGTAPDCIPSPVAWKMSTYSFFLAPYTVRWAEHNEITSVQVEQICARPRKKNDDSDDDDDDINTDRIVDYIHDDTKEEDLEIWSVTESMPFRHYDKHEMTLLPCHGVQSAVKSYRLSLCHDGGNCITTSHQRKICTYQEGRKGYRFGNAATVNDIDEWLWRLEA